MFVEEDQIYKKFTSDRFLSNAVFSYASLGRPALYVVVEQTLGVTRGPFFPVIVHSKPKSFALSECRS